MSGSGPVVVAPLCVLSLLCGCTQTPEPAPVRDAAPEEKDLTGTTWIDFAGYERCPVLFNDEARVVLGPHCGGRVLEYSLRGRNALYLDPTQDGWKPDPAEKNVQPCAGRFDIGPETAPPHPTLWSGAWTAELTGARRARMTSQDDPAVGLRVVRDFVLAADSTHLTVAQTLVNVSDSPKTYCYWGRSFSPPGGTCIVPLTPPSRFPGGYFMLTPRSQVWYRPKDPQVEMGERFAVVKGPPKHPEIGFDSWAGWMAYHLDGMLFVKKFPVYPDRVYNSMVPVTVVLYWVSEFCELEPFGPAQRIEPGESASFTVDWWLVPYAPAGGATDPDEAERIATECR